MIPFHKLKLDQCFACVWPAFFSSFYANVKTDRDILRIQIACAPDH